MDVQEKKSTDKPKFKPLSLDEFNPAVVKADLVGPGAPQTDESKQKEIEWQEKNAFEKFGSGAKVGLIGMKSGIQSTIAELMPVFMGNISPAPEQASYAASQVLKQKAAETLAKRNEIYGHGTAFELGTFAPLLASIVASGGFGLTGAALTRAGMAGAGALAGSTGALIGEGTLLAMTADVYGNSILEQEKYQEDTGKEIPELMKQGVALFSAAAMITAGKIIGSGVKGVNKLLGNSISSSLIENPEVAQNMFRRYIADNPSAIRRIGQLTMGVGKETLKSGGAMGFMTLAQDLAANINKYPEDRLMFQEIITNTLQSIKSGAMLGLILGPIQAGQTEAYHYMRRKKAGINLAQTTDGNVYEVIGDSPTEAGKVTVLDKNMKFKDIRKEDIIDRSSMTMAEKEQLLDAYKTHQEAMPGIEEAIKRNAVKRKASELTEALIFDDMPGRKRGINTAAKGGAFVRIINLAGEKFFVKKVSPDGSLADLIKIVPKPDGTFEIKRSMLKNFDKEMAIDVPVQEFAQMAVEYYTTAEANAPKPNVDPKTGAIIDPLTRQAAEDKANKTAQPGEEIDYMGRKWEVDEITFDGKIVATELKEDGEYGERIEISPSDVEKVGEPVEEPVQETVKVAGKEVPKDSTPIYEKDGVPIDRDYIEGAIEAAETPKDLYGLRWEYDDKLETLYKKKFPEMRPFYKLNGKDVTPSKLAGAIDHASSLAALKKIEINLDPELQAKYDAKVASLTPAPEIKPVEEKKSSAPTFEIKTPATEKPVKDIQPKRSEKAAPAEESTPSAPVVAEKPAEESPIEKRAREAKEEAESKIDYEGFWKDVSKEIEEPKTREEAIAIMDKIQVAVEKAGWSFEVDNDADPDFSAVNVYYKGELSKPDEMQPVMRKLFDTYSTLMHDSHDGPRIVPGGLKSAEEIKTEIEAAREDVLPEPTDAQKEAGNYPKGHVHILGMPISIETVKGGIRSGTDPSGKEWAIEMQNDYGHILGTESTDGEPVDVMIGDVKDGQDIFIVDQVNPNTGEFDEQKVMLGFDSEEEAKAAYLSNYEQGWKGLGDITELHLPLFKVTVRDKANTTKPVQPTKWRIDKPTGKYFKNEQGETEEQVRPTGPEKSTDTEDTIRTGPETSIGGTEKKSPAAAGEEGIVNPIDSSKPYSEQLDQLKALSEENKPIIDEFLAKVDEALKTTASKSSFKNPTQILLKSNRPSIIKDKPWFTIAHVRDSFRFKTALEDLSQVEDIMKMLDKTGWEILKFDWVKMFKPHEWGWRILSIDLRMPNGQLVEYYMPIKGIGEGNKGGAHALFEKWRNKDVSSLSEAEWKERAEDIKKTNEIFGAAWKDYLAKKRDGLGVSESEERASFISSLKRIESLSSLSGVKSSLSSSEETYPQAHLPEGDLTAAKTGSSVTDTDTLPEGETATDLMSNDVGQGKDTKPPAQKQEFAGEIVKPAEKPKPKSDFAGDHILVVKPSHGEAETPNIVNKYAHIMTNKMIADAIAYEKKQGREVRQEMIDKQTIDSLQANIKAFGKIKFAADNYDLDALKKKWFNTNKTWKAFFEEYTGVKLGKTLKEINANLEAFTKNKPNFGKDETDTGISNTTGLGTSEVDGGLPSTPPIGTLPGEQTAGISGAAGGQSGESDQPVTRSGEDQTVSGGGSDRELTGATSGEGPIGANEGAGEAPESNRTEPKNLADQNHIIKPDDVIIPKGEITKARANVAAIELLVKLDKLGRNATPEEKKILAKYTGWGGLASVLDEYKYRMREWNEEWNKKYGALHEKLKTMLTPEEFRNAINSTINAHYTDIPIIRQMWSLAERLGFRGGNALEPAGGIGHFIGAMPEHLSGRTAWTSYELDSISGRILAKLYPQANVQIKGYQDSNVPPLSQDLVITNVPFAKDAPYDAKNKDLAKFSLHNYFIAKGIKQLKPGGVGIFITSASTMDNPASSKFRQWVVTEGNADFIGAIRLPNNAFKENAGTEVTTDIVIFRKRTSEVPSEYAKDFRITDTISTSPGQYNIGTVPIDVNQYFVDHPENLLGKMMLAHEAGSGGLYSGDSQTAAPIKGMDLLKAIEERIATFPEGIMDTGISKRLIRNEQASREDKEGTLVVKDGNAYEVSGGELIPTSWTDDKVKINGKTYQARKVAEDYISLKNTTNKLLDIERDPKSTDADIEVGKKELNKVYDAFVKAYGDVNKNKNLWFLEHDSEFNMVAGLEDIEVEIKLNKIGRPMKRYSVVKSPIFSKRVNFPVVEPTEADNIEDAFNISLGYRNKVDPEYIAGLVGSTADQISAELIKEGYAFRNPKTGLLEEKDEYLSGYVKTKYNEAVAAAKDDPSYENNVKALEAVLPKTIPGQLIKFRLGTPWMPAEIAQAFIKEVTDLDIKVSWVSGIDKWALDTRNRYYSAKNNTSGAGGMTGIKLIEHAMHLSRPKVLVKYPGEDKPRLDPEATAAAVGKMEEILDNFVNFVLDNPEHVKKIEKIYNEEYNNFIEKKQSLPTFDYYPGANHNINLYIHQRKGVERGKKSSLLLAHQVGTGKTFTLITTAMELRRLNLAKKPMIVVQNSTIEQFAKSFRLLYPSAKLLVAEKNDAKPDKRQRVFNKIAYGDWDAVIIPQSFLNFIPDDPAREQAYIDEKIAELTAIRDDAKQTGGAYGNPIFQEAQNAINAIEKKLEKAKEKKAKKVKDIAKTNLAAEKKARTQLSRRRDDVRSFEKMGVDALLVDEAHAYKKLGFATAMSNVRGIDTKGSQRALSLMLKIKYIQEKMNGRNVILSTGTPISNTMAEVWTMMKYIAPEVLKAYHIDSFDAFASTYGKVEPSLEFTASGKFKTVDRFKSYQNAPELMLAFRANTDVVLTEDVPEFKQGDTIPKLKDGKFTQFIIPQTQGLTDMMARFKAIMENWEAMTGMEKRENRHIPLVVFTRAKQAAIDLRLLSPSFADDPGSKTNAAIKEVLRIYKSTDSYKGTQVIFCDMFQSPDKKGEERFNLYKDIKHKLVLQGIPADEIEIISDQADAARENIFDKFNEGKIRILMGSTEKLGTGVNIQVLLAAAHHLDAPPRPMDFEQRNGRIIRQGNTHASMKLPIEVITYGVEKTLDATAYQRLAIKQKFINQMMKGEGLDRDVADAAEEEMATDMTFDQMMATLTGSQYAILLYQKEYDLRKVQTAYRSWERNIIEANMGLQSEIGYAQRAKERLIKAKEVEKMLQDKFKDGKITSLSVGWGDGKSKEIFKGFERKDVAEKLQPYLQKLMDDTLNAKKDVSVGVSEWISKVHGDNKPTLYIEVNGFKGTVRFNPDSLVNTWRSQFDYSIPVIPDMYKDISSGFSNASGLVVSVEAQAAKMIEQLVPDEEKNLKEHNEAIPVYQEALKKTFDKEDKLNKLVAEVADLKAKITAEAEANKGKGNKDPGDMDLDVDIDDGGPSEPEPQYRRIKDFSEEELPSIFDNPQYPKYQFTPGEFAGQQVDAMREHEFMRRAEAMSDYTGVPIHVVRSKTDLPVNIRKDIEKRFGPIMEQTIPSVYDKGQVWVVMENTKSVSEMVSNLSHEIFAHHGLPALLGAEAYKNVLQLVYRGMSPVDVVNIAENYDIPETDWEKVAGEYLGNMAENNAINPSLWQRIIAKIREWIRKLFNISMSKAEIITLLKKSKDNLVQNKPQPKDFENMGEYLDALTAFTKAPYKAESEYGYGVRVSESQKITETLGKGNQDYQTYFAVAEGLIGKKPAQMIERALANNELDYNKALDELEAKKIKYAAAEKHADMLGQAYDYLSSTPPKNQNALYKVLVGKGKDPGELDFLSWEKPVDINQKERILNQLEGEGIYDVTVMGSFQSGQAIYNKVTQLLGSTREASLFMDRAGIDGMAFTDTAPGQVGTITSKGYVLYDNTPLDLLNEIQYKRIKKSPAFVGEHVANAGKVYSDQEKTKRSWNERVQGMREYIQDMALPVRKFEEEVIKRGGLQPNDAKPYRDISLAFGRQETMYKDFMKTKMRPVQETVSKIIRSGMPGENILPYMISKHAIERNTIMRAEELDRFINKDLKNPPTQAAIDELRDDIENKDYSGVMSFDINNEFISPDELARTIVDEFEAAVPNSLISELWNNVRGASSAVLDYWEAGQQISPEKKQEYIDRFQNFIPLRGWREGVAKDLVYVKGEGFKKSLVHAEGRKSLADNPLVHMQNVAFSAIGEQMDNEVKTSMLKLLMRNLQSADLYDLATVKKLYYVRIELPDGTEEWMPTLDRPPQDMFDSGDAVTKIYNEHQRLRTPGRANEHEVYVRRQGGDVVMIFKGKQLSTAQAMNKRNFMYHNIFGKVKDARVMNQAVTGLSYMNNFLKAAYTSWNVVFPFTNFMRDFQEASITQFIKGDAGHKVVANYTRAFPSIIRNMRGRLDMNNPDDVKLRDFYQTGGATGFTHQLAAEDLERSLNKEIERMVSRGTVRGDIKHFANEVVKIIELENQLFEDATRFSVYLTSLELGKTKEEAASDAKEASVNFNRKGKASKLYDAIYAFWNVATQSLQKNAKLAKDFPKRFAMVASAFMALGFLEALLNKATDDEDPENDYYNINPYMRENYIILPNLPKMISGESKGNRYLSIPLPQFWRGFKSIGSLAFDLTQDKVTVDEAITKALLNFGGAMSPIDIGGFGKTGEFSLAPLVPTTFKPFYDIATNRNYMGYTIAREPFDKAQKKLLADSGLGKSNVNPAAKFFTDMLFRWGGGDNATKYYINKTGEEKQVPGFLDINPSFVEHLFKGYTGGTGTVFSDLITTVSQALTPDQEVDFKNIPFVNKFLRETPEAKWNIIADYYNLKDDVSVHKGLKRAYQQQAEAGGSTEGIEATEGSSYYNAYQDILDTYDKDIKEISDAVDFTDVEGTKPIYDLMQQCIADIKALKQQYKK